MPQIKIDGELCIGCRICAMMCPEGVLDLIGDCCAIVVDLNKCSACMACEKDCPRNAIRVKIEEK